MKKCFLVFFFSLLSNLVFSQTNNEETKPDSTEYTSVQIEASFPGGIIAWKRFLERTLDTKLAKKCLKIPKGKKKISQTVVVVFKVDEEGNVSEVVAENVSAVCSLLAKEAVRVIQKGPRWNPAQLNGKNVVYRQRQSITWVLED